MAEHVDDPCGAFGTDQKRALVWFFAVILLGSGLTYGFMQIDRRMYDSNAEFFNYETYNENRQGQAGLKGDDVDARSHGDYTAVIERD